MDRSADQSSQTSRWRKWLLAGDALPFSCLIAMGAHAAVIAVAVNLRSEPEPPQRQLMLARGWSSGLDDRSDASTMRPGSDGQPILRPPDSTSPPDAIDLATARRAFDLPAEVLTPQGSAPSSTARFPAGGTTGHDVDFASIAGANTAKSPPPSRRQPPLLSDGSGAGNAEGAGASAGTSASAGVPNGSLDAVAVPIGYPSDALRKGWTGFVRVQFDVDARGRVVGVKIIEPDPQPLFNDAVREGLRRWRAPQFLWNTSANVLPVVFKLPAGR
jgi:TonB family protein